LHVLLYTSRSVAECTAAIGARINAKPTANRIELDGVVRKGGSFTLSTTTSVIRFFPRTTQLTGQLTREKGYTVIRVDVSEGVDAKTLRWVLVALAIGIAVMAAQGLVLLGILLAGLGTVLFVIFSGDRVNSEVLLAELTRVLGAKHNPPRGR
jgi:hypothetical protein